MYIVEFEQTTKTLTRGGVLVAGVKVSVYRVTKRLPPAGQATPVPRRTKISELLAERFFQGDDCGVELKRDVGHVSIRIPDLSPEQKGRLKL